MAFQRALWHSGLNYQQVCPNCKSTVRYTDYALDFRPWYADGFVDCPVCKTHLRHNENFAVDAPKHTNVVPQSNTEPQNSESFTELFCANCGNKFAENDRFCSKCGSKRG